jgi:hypothetical protein
MKSYYETDNKRIQTPNENIEQKTFQNPRKSLKSSQILIKQ